MVGGSAALLSAGLALWWRSRRGEAAGLREEDAKPEADLNALRPDPKGVLDLRAGFSYRVLQRAGERMSDGYRVPGRPDAMGCFDLGGGQWALMRNHELDRSLLRYGAYYPDSRIPEEAYDPRSLGGVTRMMLDERGELRSSNLVLIGTSRNCAGGMSPWGWLTCEESVEPQHGYVFLCSTQAKRVQRPHRIPAYGRFMHEAVAIDPNTHTAYLTEDRGDGCLYRYVPRSREAPFGEGRLQALAIEEKPRFPLGEDLPPNASFRLRWVDVPASAGDRDELRYAAQDRGAAIIRRGEGIWPLRDGFAFTSTSGGSLASGQIFHLAPTRRGGTLRLIAQPNDRQTLDMPDNITLTPWGDLLVCEDNHRAPCVRLVTQAGRVLPFAANRGSVSEFAGVCFSPDGRILFVNIQENGLTLAIEGPWQSLSNA